MTEVSFNNIITECSRIEEDAEYSAKRHFNAASLWSWVHYGIGLPMTICAAWAGIDAFSQTPELSGYLALMTAVLGALQTFMNPSEKSTNHKNCGDEYLALRNNTRIFREIELHDLEKAEAVQKVRELSDARNDLNSISPATPGIAFSMARKGIEDGQTKYKADKEKK